MFECGGRLKRFEVRYSHRSAFGDDQLLVLQAPQHAVGVNLGDAERIAQLYLSPGQQVVMIDVPPLNSASCVFVKAGCGKTARPV